MDEQIKQIAERLRGLRDVLELNAEDIARDCDIPAEEYRLAETGEFRVEQVLPGKTGDTFSLCRAAQADILLMEVSRLPAYTLENRLKLIECVRRAMPNCKFVLLCDENGDPELARRVKIARQDHKIDAFFYTSVTPGYLTAAVEAL